MKLRVPLALLALALLAWVGVRVETTLAARSAIEAARAAKAQRPAVPGAAEGGDRGAVRGKVEPWTPTLRLEGTLVPLREVDLGFKAGGRLGELRVKVGDYVRQGAVLARLEAAEATAQRRAAAAQVRSAEIALATAEDDERRMTKVVEKGVVAENTGVKVRAGRELAAAQLEAAKAQLELAATNLDNHALVAPFSGWITRAPSAPGVIVGPGLPLFHLQDVATLKLSGSVGDDEAALVAVGAGVSVAVEDRTLEGKVTAVLPSLDPATRRLPVEAQLPNDGASPVRTGAFVRAQIRGARPVSVVRLPATVLLPGARDRVVVAAGGKAELRQIRFALADGGELLVRSGVKADELVLVSPSPTTKDGDALEVSEAVARSAAR